jgi:hypothetical protein
MRSSIVCASALLFTLAGSALAQEQSPNPTQKAAAAAAKANPAKAPTAAAKATKPVVAAPAVSRAADPVRATGAPAYGDKSDKGSMSGCHSKDSDA